MKKFDFLQNLALVTQLGISMTVPIVLSIFIGNYIDKKLGTKGVFLIIFIILGIGASISSLFRLTMKKDKKNEWWFSQ